MKIVFYRGEYNKKFNYDTIWSDPVGGSEFASIWLGEELAKRGHDITFLNSCDEGEWRGMKWLNTSDEKGQVDYSVVAEHLKSLGKIDVFIVVASLVDVLKNTEALSLLADTNIINWATGLSLRPDAIQMVKNGKIDKVVCTGEYAMKQQLRNNGANVSLENIIKNLITFNSPTPTNKFTFIQNGVRRDLFDKLDAPKVRGKVIYSGVFNRGKNPDKILAVFDDIKKEVPGFELHMFGSIAQYGKDASRTYGFDGEDFFSEVKPYIFNNKEEIKDGLFLRGALGPKELAKEIKSAEIVVVNPAVGNLESSCLGALEAQAASTPVIGGGKSALSETIKDDQAGIVIQEQGELARAIIKLLKDDELRAKLGLNGRKRVMNNITWNKLAIQWEDLFNSLINNSEFLPQMN